MKELEGLFFVTWHCDFSINIITVSFHFVIMVHGAFLCLKVKRRGRRKVSQTPPLSAEDPEAEPGSECTWFVCQMFVYALNESLCMLLFYYINLFFFLKYQGVPEGREMSLPTWKQKNLPPKLPAGLLVKHEQIRLGIVSLIPILLCDYDSLHNITKITGLEQKTSRIWVFLIPNQFVWQFSINICFRLKASFCYASKATSQKEERYQTISWRGRKKHCCFCW